MKTETVKEPFTPEFCLAMLQREYKKAYRNYEKTISRSGISSGEVVNLWNKMQMYKMALSAVSTSSEKPLMSI